MEYYSTAKKNEITNFADKKLELETVILIVVFRCIVLYMQFSKNYKN